MNGKMGQAVKAMGRWGAVAILLTMLALPWSQAAYSQAPWQASFDCNKARGKIELLICAQSGLAELDLQLADVYSQARAQSSDQQALTTSQRAWIATRNACGDISCLRDAYLQRISDLQNPAPSRAAFQSQTPANDTQQIANCDLFAAHPFDPQKRAAGTTYRDLQPSAAMDACTAAVAAQPNEGRLHFQLGRALEKANQLQQAIAAYQRAAQLGHAGGYSNLGELYRDGKGFARNPQRAEENFREAAAKGFPEAQFSLANLLLAQSRSAENVEQARQLLEAAANSGYAAANGVLNTLQPVATVVSSSSPVGLLELAGKYAAVSAVGKPANCDKNDFTLSFNGDQLTFTERNGKRHVERILNFADGQLEAQVISSPDVTAGTLYRYTVEANGSLGVRNLGSGAAFALVRCATAATAQAATTSDQNAALSRQQAEATERERQAEAQRAADDAARRIAALEAQQRATVEAQQRVQAAERERQAAAERERQAGAQRVAEELRQREQAAELERQAAAKREADLQAQIVAAQKAAEEQWRMLMVGGGVAVALIVLAFGVAASIKRKRSNAKSALDHAIAAPQPIQAPAMAMSMKTEQQRTQTPPPEMPPLSVADAASLFATDPDAPSVKIIDDAGALLSEQMRQLVSALKVRSVQLCGSNTVTAAEATALTRLPKFTRINDAMLVIEDTAANYFEADNGPGIRAASQSILVGINTVSAYQAQRLTMIPRFRVRGDATFELSDTAAAILSSHNASGIKIATRLVITGPNTVDPAQATLLATLPRIKVDASATLVVVGDPESLLSLENAAGLSIATSVRLASDEAITPSRLSALYKIHGFTTDAENGSQLFSAKPLNPTEQDDQQRIYTKKKCPFCAEDIHSRATKCKHCGSLLSEKTSEKATTTYDPSSPKPIPTIDYSQYYVYTFQKFEANGGSFVLTFNWAAFLFGVIWYFNKRLWGKGFLMIVAIFLLGGLPAPLFCIYAGCAGNYDYYRLRIRGRQF